MLRLRRCPGYQDRPTHSPSSSERRSEIYRKALVLTNFRDACRLKTISRLNKNSAISFEASIESAIGTSINFARGTFMKFGYPARFMPSHYFKPRRDTALLTFRCVNLTEARNFNACTSNICDTLKLLSRLGLLRILNRDFPLENSTGLPL